MPTDQPSNAPDATLAPREEATPAAVLRDERLDDPAGGGGLNGASAAAGSRAASGTAPNAPIDVPVPAATRDDDGMKPAARSEARAKAIEDDAPEPHPSSQ